MAEQIPTPEASKLEWGPSLGLMTWDNATKKLDELNTSIKNGEKPWRLPTVKEITDAIDNGEEFNFYSQGGGTEMAGICYYLTSEVAPVEGATKEVVHVVEHRTKHVNGFTKYTSAPTAVRFIR